MKINFLKIKPDNKELENVELEFNEVNLKQIISNELNIETKELQMDLMPHPLTGVVVFYSMKKPKGLYKSEDLNFLFLESIPCFGEALFCFISNGNQNSLESLNDDLKDSVFEHLLIKREQLREDKNFMKALQEKIDSGFIDKVFEQVESQF